MKLSVALVLIGVSLMSCCCCWTGPMVSEWVGPITPRMGEGWGVVRGSGPVTEVTRDVGAFTGVELMTFGDLFIEAGDEPSLRIEAQGDLLEYFEAHLQGDTLEITARPGVSIHTTRPVRFYLTTPALDKVVVSGSGDVSAPDLVGERVLIDIRGSGDVKTGDLSGETVVIKISSSGELDVATCTGQDLQVNIAGSGDLAIKAVDLDTIAVHNDGSGIVYIQGGAVDRQSVVLNGSGDYNAPDLRSEEADVRTVGSATIAVNVEKHLVVYISGSGDVIYNGTPEINQYVTGSGDIVLLDD